MKALVKSVLKALSTVRGASVPVYFIFTIKWNENSEVERIYCQRKSAFVV